MISLQLRHSPLIKSQLARFQQHLTILRIYTISYSQDHSNNIIKLAIQANDSDTIIKIISLADTIFYPNLLGYTKQNISQHLKIHWQAEQNNLLNNL